MSTESQSNLPLKARKIEPNTNMKDWTATVPVTIRNLKTKRNHILNKFGNCQFSKIEMFLSLIRIFSPASVRPELIFPCF